MSIADDINKILEKMPNAFLPEKAGNLNATIQLELTGEGGGDSAECTLLPVPRAVRKSASGH